MPASPRLSDDFIRRLVLSQPVPAKLIRDLAALPDLRHPGHKYAGRRSAMTPILWETLKLVAAGYGAVRIAEEHDVPRDAAKDRIKRLLAYFDEPDRMALVVRCYREGIM